MTGYADEAAFRHGLIAFGAQVLRKPFSQRSLAVVVRQALDTLTDPPPT